MNKKIKIILIILGIVLVIALLIPIGLWGMFAVADAKQDIEEKSLEDKGISYAIKHLEGKYPDMKFKIVEAEADELYNGFVHGGWGDTVEVEVESNGIEYLVCVDISKDENNCYDNVQEKEIKQAIKNKLIKISGIKTDYELELDMTHYWEEFCFNGKYEGNITEFLQKEYNISENWEFTAHIGYADGIEDFNISEDDAQFLGLFDIVAFVNFKDKIPSTMYSYYRGEYIVEALWDRQIPFNHVWTYRKSTKEFKDISTEMTRTAVV